MNIAAIQNSFNLIGAPTLPLQEQLWLGLYADKKRLLYFTGNQEKLLQVGNYTLFTTDEQSAKESIAALCKTDIRLQQNFSTVTLIYDGDFELIPDAFFIPNLSSLADKISEHIHLVYQPKFDIAPLLHQFFPAIKKMHSGSALLQSILNGHPSGNIGYYAMVHTDFLDIVVVGKDSQLLFYNRYDYKTPTDFIYYILLVCDYMQLDRAQLTLQLLGEISTGSAIFTVCYRYFEKVVLLKPASAIAFGDGFDDFPRHIHYHLYHSLLCAS